MFVVGHECLDFEPVGQALVQAAQPELEEVDRFLVAAGEEEHRRGRVEENEPEGKAEHQPGQTQLPGF